LFLFRASGELGVKIWRDKDRRPDTIKVAADFRRRRNDYKENVKRIWGKSQKQVARAVSQYKVAMVVIVSRCSVLYTPAILVLARPRQLQARKLPAEIILEHSRWPRVLQSHST
jgi:hypothetical protein